MMDYEDDVNLSDLWKAKIIFFMKPTGNFVLLEGEKKKQKKIRIKFKKKFIDTKN